jgi:UPF0716 protein FxsA
MNVAKSLLLAVLALPVMELAAFIAVAATIGVLPALALIAAGSVAGLVILRHAGGNHIARVRVALDQGSFSALEADSTGGATLFAGFLLLIPGFITDALGLLLLVVPLRRGLSAVLQRGGGGAADRGDGVVDLAPEQWRRVPDPELPDRRKKDREQG